MRREGSPRRSGRKRRVCARAEKTLVSCGDHERGPSLRTYVGLILANWVDPTKMHRMAIRTNRLHRIRRFKSACRQVRHQQVCGREDMRARLLTLAWVALAHARKSRLAVVNVNATKFAKLRSNGESLSRSPK